MIDQAIRAKIKKIKINTKRIVRSALVGDYLSAFKGSGLEFDQIREYQMGDDVRSIDWNNSAKMNKIMVKQFIEERERTVILAVDVSASTRFSSQHELCCDTIAQLAATLALVAGQNKDKVGALFFSDVVERWIPPSKGNVHMGTIIETIFSLQPKSKKTDLAAALKFLVNLKKRNAVVFMISDWVDEQDYQTVLRIAGCEFDFVAIRMLDSTLKRLPDIGLLTTQDPESGQLVVVDTRMSRYKKKSINTFLASRLLAQKKLFEKYRIDMLDLVVANPFINQLVNFFHQRIRRQI